MATSKGFIQCPERHCSGVAEVKNTGEKSLKLYSKCQLCGDVSFINDKEITAIKERSISHGD